MSNTPPHAANIWLVGDQLHIHFPMGGGHTVNCKADALGLKWVLELLKARAHSGDEHHLKIGHRPSEPSQYQLEAMIKHMKATGRIQKIEPKKDGSDVTLEELGL